jgi:hypothetical protein
VTDPECSKLGALPIKVECWGEFSGVWSPGEAYHKGGGGVPLAAWRHWSGRRGTEKGGGGPIGRASMGHPRLAPRLGPEFFFGAPEGPPRARPSLLFPKRRRAQSGTARQRGSEPRPDGAADAYIASSVADLMLDTLLAHPCQLCAFISVDRI